MPVDRKISVAEDELKPLMKGHGHVVVERWVVACDGCVPLVLRETGDNDVGNLHAPVTVVWSADDIFRKIKRSAEFRTAGYNEPLLNEWPRRFDRRKEVFAVRILSNAEQDGPDLNDYEHHSSICENPPSFALARV